jgi:hypothetical protein
MVSAATLSAANLPLSSSAFLTVSLVILPPHLCDVYRSVPSTVLLISYHLGQDDPLTRLQPWILSLSKSFMIGLLLMFRNPLLYGIDLSREALSPLMDSISVVSIFRGVCLHISLHVGVQVSRERARGSRYTGISGRFIFKCSLSTKNDTFLSAAVLWLFSQRFEYRIHLIAE